MNDVFISYAHIDDQPMMEGQRCARPSETGSGRSMFDSSFNRLTLRTAIALTPLGSPAFKITG